MASSYQPLGMRWTSGGAGHPGVPEPTATKPTAAAVVVAAAQAWQGQGERREAACPRSADAQSWARGTVSEVKQALACIALARGENGAPGAVETTRV